jgi:hypothetical protein
MNINELIVRQVFTKYAAAIESLPMDAHAHVRAQTANAAALGVLLTLVAPNSPKVSAAKRAPDNLDRLSAELDDEAKTDRKFPPDGSSPASKLKCRECGCTDTDCRECIQKIGMPCKWVEDDLCSACCSAPIASLRTFPCAGGCGTQLVLQQGDRCRDCETAYFESRCAVCDELKIPGSEHCRQHTHPLWEGFLRGGVCGANGCQRNVGPAFPTPPAFCELHTHECLQGCPRRVRCEGDTCDSCRALDLEPPSRTPELIKETATHPADCRCPGCVGPDGVAFSKSTSPYAHAMNRRTMRPPKRVVSRPDDVETARKLGASVTCSLGVCNRNGCVNVTPDDIDYCGSPECPVGPPGYRSCSVGGCHNEAGQGGFCSQHARQSEHA